MEFQTVYQTLTNTPAAVRNLLAEDEGAAIRYRQAPEKWSILEVLGHLLDEEREDFPVRILSTLADPDRPWTPIDPEARVRARREDARSAAELLDAFAAARAAALARVRAVPNPDWNRTYAHPKAGPIRAGDLLAAWAAHDFHHLRQITNLQLAYLESVATPYHTRYAT